MNDISIIIATCGRPERLARTLSALDAAVARWGGRAQMIIVDNHPDHTAASIVKAHFAPHASRHTYLKSEPFNKARALNMGIAAADTEWLAFTDDDTMPDAGWLAAGTAYARESGFRVVGGRIVSGPDPDSLPRWLRPGRSGRVPGIGVHVRYDPMEASGTLAGNGTAPFGANLFVHRDVFVEHGGYDEALWETCRRMWPTGSEDSEFGHRLKLRGEPIGYCREALVVHPVNADRASLRMHLWRAYCDGWRQPLIFTEEPAHRFSPFRFRTLLGRMAGAIADVFRADVAGAADHLVEAARVMGRIVGEWQRAGTSNIERPTLNVEGSDS